MTAAPLSPETLSDEWCEKHFDYLSPDFARELHPTLARMRATCPVAHSDARGGYWVLTRYEDVLRTAQDWETFSNQLGVGIPHTEYSTPAIPEHIDPPLQRVYKKLVSAWFTPTIVRPYEDATRRLVTRMLDAFIERGECDFMAAFAKPFPALAFFELVLNAPADEIAEVAHWAERTSIPTNPDNKECWQKLSAWIRDFVDARRSGPEHDDVVNAIIHAQIEGRPATDTEIIGMILLLIMGGLDTTAGVLGQTMMRFCRDPKVPELLRSEPALINDAVEELLRLDGSFVAIGRTVRHDTEIDGNPIKAGEKVLISWASANRDEAEFPDPDTFDPHRKNNRHLTFGAGPHRCVGSNLARLNLRVAIGEITQRLRDVRLTVPEAEVPFHNAFNRSPLELPITFTPGPRLLP